MKSELLGFLKNNLPDRLKNSMFHLGFHVSPEKFAEFSYLYANAPDMERGLRGARDRGLAPGVILDIGAYHGEWSRMARRLWPEAKIRMVEANLEKKPLLETLAAKIGAEVHFAVMGAEAGRQVDFFVMESGSSVYEENSPLARRVEPRSTSTVDALLGGQTVDLMKLDVQGYELEVLKGAGEVLKKCAAVILEVSLIEINKGTPLLEDVVTFMKQRGFVVYEVLGIHRRPLDKAMNQIDLIFVPDLSPLRTNRAHF